MNIIFAVEERPSPAMFESASEVNVLFWVEFWYCCSCRPEKSIFWIQRVHFEDNKFSSKLSIKTEFICFSSSEFWPCSRFPRHKLTSVNLSIRKCITRATPTISFTANKQKVGADWPPSTQIERFASFPDKDYLGYCWSDSSTAWKDFTREWQCRLHRLS